MRYTYPCSLAPDHEEGEGFVATFPDVPEAITGYRRKDQGGDTRPSAGGIGRRVGHVRALS